MKIVDTSLIFKQPCVYLEARTLKTPNSKFYEAWWANFGPFFSSLGLFKARSRSNLPPLFCPMFLRFDKLPVCLSSQGVKFVKTAMQTISLVADAVLAVRAPDEGMISIATRELSMTLGRHSLEKLAGLRIEAAGGVFVFPSDSQSLQFTVTAKGYIDTQVSMLIKVFSESS